MKKEEILQRVDARYNSLIDWLKQQDADAFVAHPRAEKWSAGQHADHILRATAPINKALMMPKLALKMTFGTNNREERSYEKTKERYLSRLSEGVVATGDFIPGEITKTDQASLIQNLQKEKDKLIAKLSKWSEEDLSKYILPHPAIGRLTIREMLYFADFHTERHHQTLLEFH